MLGHIVGGKPLKAPGGPCGESVVASSGFRVQGIEFGNQGSGCKVQLWGKT